MHVTILGGGEYDLTATLYTNTRGIPYCVFNEVTHQVPSLGEDSLENEVIEIYIQYETSSTIKNVILGAGMKVPYNFVLCYSGGSYDSSYDITSGNSSLCQQGRRQTYGIIESLNYADWLHNCNIVQNCNKFNEKDDSVIKIINVYVASSMYIKLGSPNVPSMLYAFLKQFNYGFTYDNNGNITRGRVPILQKSIVDNTNNSVKYCLLNSKSFLDNTLFFNQSLNGKFMPFMWNGTLKYFHFNAVF